MSVWTQHEAAFAAARLLARATGTDDPRACWVWQGPLNSNGYGRLSINNKVTLAHRHSFSLFLGRIPAGMNVCHTCDNRRCINPNHLWIGSQAENLRDAAAKGRMFRPDTTGEKNGNRKLNWKDVRTIRQMQSEGMPRYRLAQMFGVSASTIGEIVSNKIWKEAA